MGSGKTPGGAGERVVAQSVVRRACAATILLLAFLSGPTLRTAAPPTEGHAAPRHLRVVAAPYEPFAFDRGGTPAGLDLDVLNVVCRANGWSYELEWVPFSEVFDRLRDGRADLAAGALYSTPERRAEFPTTRPYLQTGLGLVSCPARPVLNAEGLAGLRVGVKAGATGEAWAHRRLESGPGFTIVPFSSTRESFDALVRGDVDAVLNDHVNSEYLLARDYAGLVVVARSFGAPLMLTRDELAFPFRPGLEEARDTFDATLRELERGGTLERLRWIWLPPNPGEEWRRFLGWTAASLAALVAAAVLAFWLQARRKHRLALAESERHYRQLVEEAPLGALLVRRGRVAYVNRAGRLLLAFGEGEAPLDLPVEELVSPSDRERLAAYRQALGWGKQESGGIDLLAQRPDGSTFPCHATARRVVLADGQATIVYFEDSSERLAAGAALEESETRYRQIFEDSTEGIYVSTAGGIPLLVNPALVHMLGFESAEDLLRRDIAREGYVDPKDRERFAELIARDGRVTGFESRWFRKDGSVMVARVSARAVRDTRGQVTLYKGIVSDVTEERRARAEAQTIQERLQRVVDHAPLVLFQLDAEGIFTLSEGHALRALGQHSGEVVGRSAFEVYHDNPEIVENLSRTLQGEGRSWSTRVGEQVFEIRTEPLPGADGARAGLIGVAWDITSSADAEEALTHSEARYRELFENSYDAIFLADAASGKLLDANRRAQELVGRSLDEIRAMNQMDLHPEEERERYRAVFETHARAAAGGLTTDLLVVHRDGHRIPVDIGGSTFLLGGRRIQMGIFRDIRARKTAEEAILHERDFSGSVLDSLPGVFYLFDQTGKFLRWNAALEEVTGYSSQEIGLMHPLDFFGGAEKDLIQERIGEVFATGYSTAEASLVSKGGERTPFYFNGRAIRLGGKECLIGVGIDITARRAVESALRASEERLRKIFEHSPLSMALVASDGTIESINQKAVETFGYLPEDIPCMDRWWAQAYPEKGYRNEVIATWTRLVSEALAANREIEGREYRVTCKDGCVKTIFIFGVPIDGKVFVMFQDVTERRRAEEEVRRGRERLQLILDRNPLACILWDPEFKVSFWNPAAERIFGFPASYALGRHPYDFIVPPERRAYVEKIMDRLLEGDETAHGESVNLTAQGQRIQTDWLNTPLKDPGGRVLGILSMVQDLTARRRAELEALNHNRQLSALLAASHAMTGFLDLKTSARALCEAALAAFQARMAWIGLVVPESTEVQVLASAGYDEGYTSELRIRWDESPRSQGPTGRCIKTRRPVVSHPEQTSFAPWRQAALDRGYRCSCALPLIHEDSVRGALSLYSENPEAFGPDSLDVLQIFARQATLLIVNAALYEEARRTAEALLAQRPPDHGPGTGI